LPNPLHTVVSVNSGGSLPANWGATFASNGFATAVAGAAPSSAKTIRIQSRRMARTYFLSPTLKSNVCPN
jgi:hypothetical protein